jgi:hypothetical protein
MDILQIDKTNIKSIAAFIGANKNLCEDLVTNFKGTVLRQEVNKDWIKFIIKKNAIIKSIVIDCQNSKVTGITFSGLLDIVYNDLVELFGEGVEYYERYDDTFEFVFKTNAIIDNYTIKCFILNDDKQKTNWQNEKLGNISIHLG